MPPEVITVTSTVAAVPAGEVAVICVLLFTVKLATVPPKRTPVAPDKPVPVRTTVVPPAVGPEFGDRAVNVGAATKVNRSPAFVTLVPPAEVTVTSTVPVPAGEIAVICVSLLIVKLTPVPPKRKLVAP